MQGPSTLKNIYHVDTSEFVNSLKSHGFEVYDNIYANSYHTLGTLTTMMSIGRLVPKNSNLDGNSGDRTLIPGGNNNHLMKIFKNNGYITKLYLDGSSYFGTIKGKYLDYYDGFMDTNFYNKLYYYTEPFKQICKSSWRGKIDSLLDKYSTQLSHCNVDTLSIIKEQNKSSSPFIVFRRLNKLDHTPSDGSYNYKQKENWMESRFYQTHLNEQFHEIEDFIKVINKNDPNAVIILLGDHGSWRLREYPFNRGGEKLYDFAQNDGETLRSAADDVFHVFAAVRLPNGLKLAPNFSSVNVFLKIFALLNPSQKENIDKYILPNYSSFYLMSKDKITLVDGILQDDKSWYYDPEKIVSWTELIQKMDLAK